MSGLKYREPIEVLSPSNKRQTSPTTSFALGALVGSLLPALMLYGAIDRAGELAPEVLDEVVDEVTAQELEAFKYYLQETLKIYAELIDLLNKIDVSVLAKVIDIQEIITGDFEQLSILLGAAKNDFKEMVTTDNLDFMPDKLIEALVKEFPADTKAYHDLSVLLEDARRLGKYNLEHRKLEIRNRFIEVFTDRFFATEN